MQSNAARHPAKKASAIRGAAFICLLAFLFYLLNRAYMHTYHYQTLDGFFQYQEMENQLDIVAFGTSHSRNGIDFRPFEDIKGFNFAFAAQFPTQDYMLMQSYRHRFAKDCVVVIPLSYFVMYGAGTYTIERYIKFVKPEYLPDYSAKTALLYRYFPLLSAQHDVMRFFEQIEPWRWSVGKNEYALISMALPVEEREWTAQAIVEQSWMGNYMQGGQKVDEGQWQALNGMLNLCKENGWQAVLIAPPMPAYTQKYLPDSFWPKYYADVARLMESHPKAVFWDYGQDAQFKNSPDLFADVEHLSKEGNRLFTARLLQDCRSAGYL